MFIVTIDIFICITIIITSIITIIITITTTIIIIIIRQRNLSTEAVLSGADYSFLQRFF